ncbi:MAG: metalloregulator ArsR/SmtB family transcription factor [Chitinispirillales bacterium]|jgi:ArsR family transcriptional regulator|nr:metalloregulator ArsR/SmtB family transcription factor [Chitinispirillales bacterium]
MDFKENDFAECDCETIHKEVVESVAQNMPVCERLFLLADFFKMFSDSTRIRIIAALLNSEMCVCDIAFLLNMTKSAISHQLRMLRQTKLVKFRKKGKIVYYSLDDEHIKDIVETGLSHINEEN